MNQIDEDGVVAQPAATNHTVLNTHMEISQQNALELGKEYDYYQDKHVKK